MRLERHLNESFTLDDVDDIIMTIRRDCQPFLQEFNMNFPVYRGTHKDFEGSLLRVRSRTKRVPRDTPKHLHKLLDDILYRKFGWKARSEGVFVSKDRKSIGSYGYPHMVFPKGKYKYVWSPEIKDLYRSIRTDVIAEIDELNRKGYTTRDIRADQVDDEFKQLLEILMRSYKDTGYERSTEPALKNEAMFQTRDYYIVYFQDTRENEKFLKMIKDKY